MSASEGSRVDTEKIDVCACSCVCASVCGLKIDRLTCPLSCNKISEGGDGERPFQGGVEDFKDFASVKGLQKDRMSKIFILHRERKRISYRGERI